LLLLTIVSVSVVPMLAQSAVHPKAESEAPFRAEVALGYTYLHSNAPPGGCGCFSLNGGGAEFSWTLKDPRFALAADGFGAHQGNAANTGDALTLSAYTAGARYLPRLGHSSWHPFGQVLVGLAHSSGSLVQGSNTAATNAGAAFAAKMGGGVDLRINHRFSIRLIEADYLLTTFDNGTNNHQNNLRINAGVVIHFAK
jgi:peptidoglycan-associated lipoprotein